MKYSITHTSRIGKRKTNQDRVAIVERANAVLMVVADGLGGYAGGDLAAETMVEGVVRSFEQTKKPLISDPDVFLMLSVIRAHSMINTRARENGLDVSRPRTTCVICLVQNGYAYWAHVGDSRLYHYRDGRMLGRTLDHTTAEQLRKDGILSEEDLRDPTQQGHLVRCVGGTSELDGELGTETPLEYGDGLLLCTDGVWRAFANDEMAAYLEHEDMEQGISDMLTQAQTNNGADCDNMAVAALRWEDDVPLARPLMANRAQNIDPRQLWRQARRMSRPGPKPSEPARSNRTSTPDNLIFDEVETTVEEIEDFVDRIDEIF